MIIAELTYKKSLDEVNKFLEEHRKFLDNYYSQGIFIASGPKYPRDGGIILAMTDKDNMMRIIKEDPFYCQEIADYKVVQFEANKYSRTFEAVING
ncbi:MAG: YciI family protein [Pseudomonadota bacterium]